MRPTAASALTELTLILALPVCCCGEDSDGEPEAELEEDDEVEVGVEVAVDPAGALPGDVVAGEGAGAGGAGGEELLAGPAVVTEEVPTTGNGEDAQVEVTMPSAPVEVSMPTVTVPHWQYEVTGEVPLGDVSYVAGIVSCKRLTPRLSSH